jgi:hypothetical protein
MAHRADWRADECRWGVGRQAAPPRVDARERARKPAWNERAPEREAERAQLEEMRCKVLERLAAGGASPDDSQSSKAIMLGGGRHDPNG